MTKGTPASAAQLAATYAVGYVSWQCNSSNRCLRCSLASHRLYQETNRRVEQNRGCHATGYGEDSETNRRRQRRHGANRTTSFPRTVSRRASASITNSCPPTLGNAVFV